jgi:MarR family 2-MHQ and catechol resistance regulon transcriptional repressor
VPPETTGALRLWVVLARAYRAVEARARAHAARHGFTLAEFGVLEALYHKGPLPLGELRRKLLVSSGGTTYLVDRLERKGLVERRPCPRDGRVVWAWLTPAGEAQVRALFPDHAHAIAAAMGALTEEEQRQATALLRRLGHGAAAG